MPRFPLAACLGAAFVTASLATAAGLSPLRAETAPAEAAPQPAEPSARERSKEPRSGSETYTSLISEVDACNRAQKLRPEGSIITGMHYWREGDEEERRVSCRASWSLEEEARPTRRPILFGRSA